MNLPDSFIVVRARTGKKGCSNNTSKFQIKRLTNFVTWVALSGALCAAPTHAESLTTVPAVCQETVANEVALIDCLQTQQDIAQHILNYETLLVEVNAIREQSKPPPPPDTVNESPDADNAWDAVMERVTWFDQNIEVYAIVGTPGALTAHARLEGREYRLRLGDQIRLAKVVGIEPRTVYLEVSGAEFAISLSAHSTPSTQPASVTVN